MPPWRCLVLGLYLAAATAAGGHDFTDHDEERYMEQRGMSYFDFTRKSNAGVVAKGGGCNPPCQNQAVCISPNQCVCSFAHSGPQCQYPFRPCQGTPNIPNNSEKSCNQRRCLIQCYNNHKFPSGDTSLVIHCSNGVWTPNQAGFAWNNLPDCLPECDPPCANGGKCLSNNQCDCPQEFGGPQCQYAAESCSINKLNFNGGHQCTGDNIALSCTISCPKGVSFEYPPATAYTCNYATGIFLPAQVPQCKYEDLCVKPKCGAGYKLTKIQDAARNVDAGRHGGKVKLSCPRYQCVDARTGEESCSIRKLNFNGGHDCKGDGTTLSCSISCPQGVQFEFPPAPKYTCNYAVGRFEPTQVPQCDYESLCVKPSCGAGFQATKVQDASYTSPNKAGTGKITFTCPRYECTAVLGDDNTCIVEGKNFKTFDGFSFRYTVCNHILLQDHANKNWTIAERRTCTDLNGCKNQLDVTQNENMISLKPDFSVDYEGQVLTADEADNIGSRLQEFSLTENENEINFESLVYGFSIHFNNKGDAKIQVPASLRNHINGLCGKFNGLLRDETSKPNGQIAISIKEFGDSWRVPGSTEMCHDDSDIYEPVAVEICNSMSKKQPLNQCDGIVVGFCMNTCIDDTIACLTNKKTREVCRCEAFEKYARECRAKLPNVDLSSWRTQNNCPVTCPAGLVYRDCYNRRCEVTCENAHNKNACPIVANMCKAGCYCPDGMVRKGSRCIKAQECKDCTCWGHGDPHYQTFDGTTYDFQGKCSYVATRDVVPRGREHEFQVLVTNKACVGYPGTTCTEAVTVLYRDHVIHMRRGADGKQPVVTEVDASAVTKFPLHKDWIILESLPRSHVTLLIPEIQLEVTYLASTWKFVVRLASKLFPDNFEGLCGNCNKIKADDFYTQNGKTTKNVNEFAMSWLVEKMPIGIPVDPSCKVAPPAPPPLPACHPGYPPRNPERDPCSWIMDVATFGECHKKVNPQTHLESCRFDMCHSTDREAAGCRAVTAYAQECQAHDMCLEWRSKDRCPLTCPLGLQYKTCGFGCEINCHNFERYKRNPNSCPLDPKEGCFCPDGQVLKNGRCVAESQCRPCDNEGHIVGDEWNPDQCTKCSCVAEGNRNVVKCTSAACPEPIQCKPGYKAVELAKTAGDCCAQYKCVEHVCKTDGKNIKTFDGLRRQNKICDHILLHDVIKNAWTISYHNKCTRGTACNTFVQVQQDSHVFKIKKDFSAVYDDKSYSVRQLQSIGQKGNEFKISQVGDSVFFESQRYGFWILFDNRANVKIGVSDTLHEKVSGLCGNVNNVQDDDPTSGWVVPGATSSCDETTCSANHRTKGAALCRRVLNENPACSQWVGSDEFLAFCAENMCTCLAAETEEYCRCDAALAYVKACKIENPSFDLDSWRVTNRCPISCPAGLVHHDCFGHKCELNCDNVHNVAPCPTQENICASGCFCPDGLVRIGASCVQPTECKDCVCTGWGDPHYKTFDDSAYDFQGRCTFVASQDVTDSPDHVFQVLVTNKPCVFAPKTTCTDAVTILYDKHVIHVYRVEGHNQIVTELDGQTVARFPLQDSWLRLESIPQQQVTVFIPDIQLEVTYVYKTWAFTVKLPSQMFTNSTEGLCGNCNKEKRDDFKTSFGRLTTNVGEFGMSWLAKELPRGFNVEPECRENMDRPPQPPPNPPMPATCRPLPPKQDPCALLLDKNTFGKCHELIDPAMYVKTCQYDSCLSDDRRAGACLSVEAYARDCQRHGICVTWRTDTLCPFKCPAGTTYSACGSACTKTCQNFKKLNDNPDECRLEPTEGCYCPEGQVLHKNRCVRETECNACELEGRGCSSVTLSDAQTVGLIAETVESNGRVKKCSNKKPIPGFKNCGGFCESQSTYNTKRAAHVTEATCCKPLTFKTVPVVLTCEEDGSRYTKLVKVPTTCACNNCNDCATCAE